MSAQREWPESPDGSFWVSWEENRVTAFGLTQLGGIATYVRLANAPDGWLRVSWDPAPGRVSGGSP